MENLIQQEIIQAVLEARKRKKDIKQTIKALAKEFTLTEYAIKGIIELSATWGMEQTQGQKAGGKLWKPLNHVEEIKRIWDKLYQLESDLARTKTRFNRELGIREDPWPRKKRINAEDKSFTRIQELREKIDEVRELINEEGKAGDPR